MRSRTTSIFGLMVVAVLAVVASIGPARAEAWLGLEVAAVTPEAKAVRGLAVDEGVLVTEVEADSPAVAADIRIGDVIDRVGRTVTHTAEEFAAAVAKLTPGTSVQLLRDRRGAVGRVAVTPAVKPIGHVAKRGLAGMELRAPTAEEATAAGLPQVTGAFVVSAQDGKPAAAAGLKAGNIVLGVDGQALPDMAGVIAEIGRRPPGAKVALMVARGPARLELEVTLAERPAAMDVAAGPATPRLMLDTGGHMGLIKGLAFTPDGQQIVSAGHDKVVRVWDVASGRTVRTIRGEAGAGSAGKVFALALSPDGRWLAVGGWMKMAADVSGHQIRLYDFVSGRLVALLPGHGDVVTALAFSPDGRRLVSGSSDKTAIIWDIAVAAPVSAGSTESGAASAAAAPVATLRHRLQGHTEIILAVAFSPDGTRIVTGSDDRTLRLWAAADGTPIGEPLTGHTKDIDRALAIRASDGLIASGDGAGEIRLWDRDGRPLRVLANQGGSVGRLAFSADGRRLLATCGGAGCRPAFVASVYDIATGAEIARHSAHDSIVLAAAIAPDGRTVATGGGNDNTIHLWDLGAGPIPSLTVGATVPKAPRLTGPDGAPLALAGTGRPAWATGVSTDGGAIAWGSTWTSHSALAKNTLEHALRLPTAGRGLGAPVQLAPPAPRPAEGANGREAPTVPDIGDFRRARVTHTGPDGTLSLRHTKGGAYGLDAVLELVRTAPPGSGAAGTGPGTTRPAAGQTPPGETMLARLERGPADGYDHRAYTFSPDGRTVVSGGMGGVTQAFDVAAVVAAAATAPNRTLIGPALRQLARPFVGHEGDVWAVTTSPDGRLLVSGSNDQTVRIWNLATAEPIVTLFHGRDDTWAMWTEQGFYTGSESAGAIVGWQLNNGPDREATYVRGGQFADTLRRRDIIERALVLASAEAAVAELAPGHDLRAVLDNRPPEIAVVTPATDTEMAGGSQIVTVFATPGTQPLAGVEIAVNGISVTPEAVAVPVGHARPVNRPGARPTLVYAYRVPLFSGANEITARARGAGLPAAKAGDPLRPGLTSDAATVRVKNNGEGRLDKRDTLYIVAVGTDDYPGLGNTCGTTLDRTCDLAFAGADARLFAATVEREMGPRHRRIVKRLLVNGGAPEDAPTAANIRTALDTLREATDNDTVVVLIAGHGETGRVPGAKQGEVQYYYLPTDVAGRAMVDAGKGENLLPWVDIQRRVTTAKGLRLLLVDTCQAGAISVSTAYNERLLEDARREDFVAFTAASANQVATELPSLQSKVGQGHGLFTFAFSRGLEGEALDTAAREVRLLGLANFISGELRKLSNGRQSPGFTPGSTGRDVVLVQR